MELPWFEGWARNQGVICVPGRPHSFHLEGIEHTSVQNKVFEMNYEESDEVIVAMKPMKVGGAKDQNTLTFLDGKHKICLQG